MRAVVLIFILGISVYGENSCGQGREEELPSDSPGLVRVVREATKKNGQTGKIKQKNGEIGVKNKKSGQTGKIKQKNGEIGVKNKKIKPKIVRVLQKNPKKSPNTKSEMKKYSKKKTQYTKKKKKQTKTKDKKKKKKAGGNEPNDPQEDSQKQGKQVCSDGVTEDCLENAMILLVFEGGFKMNFIKKYERFMNFNTTAGKKHAQQDNFEHPARHLKSALGVNTTDMSSINISCSGSENSTQTVIDFIATYNTLANCSAYVHEMCYPYQPTNGTIEQMTKCYNLMLPTKNLTDECRGMKTNGSEQCDCWQNLKTNLFDVYRAIVNPKCKIMDTIMKEMKTSKIACVDAFKVCKKAEDAAVSLIGDCMSMSTGNEVMNETKVVENARGLNMTYG